MNKNDRVNFLLITYFFKKYSLPLKKKTKSFRKFDLSYLGIEFDFEVQTEVEV